MGTITGTGSTASITWQASGTQISVNDCLELSLGIAYDSVTDKCAVVFINTQNSDKVSGAVLTHT